MTGLASTRLPGIGCARNVFLFKIGRGRVLSADCTDGPPGYAQNPG
jgi:hypothetical protein